MFKSLDRKTIANRLLFTILVVVKPLENQDLSTAHRFVKPSVVDRISDS